MDNAEFSRRAEAYRDTVYRVALNYLGSADDAEDIVQETLLRLYTTTRRFADEEHIKHWLIRVALNLCGNASRRRRRFVDAPEWSEPSVSFETERQLAMYQAVMSLPEKYRTALYLFYYEDFSVREMAEILGVSPSAVTTRLSRAREQLRELWTKEDAYGL